MSVHINETVFYYARMNVVQFAKKEVSYPRDQLVFLLNDSFCNGVST